MVRLVIIIVVLQFIYSCGGGKNYKEAYVIKDQNQLYIKLTGTRPVNSHNPGDVVSGKTYNDSFLIPIIILKNGTIRGENIPVKAGYYKYKGKVSIEGEKLDVSLFHDNYDDKKLEPLSWNGKYKLINRNNY